MSVITPRNFYRTLIIEGDALVELGSIPDNSIQLCMTSPPYNIGKSYEKGSFATFDDYRIWLKEVLSVIVLKLKPGGSLCLQLGSHVSKGTVLPLDYVFFPILNEMGLIFRNRIIWKFNFGLHAQHRLSGRYETLLWFTKGAEYKFNLDPIRVAQLYPGKRHAAKKGIKAGTPSGNPLGKNPSDFWTFEPEEAFLGEAVWDIPNVKANHPEKTEHPCQFPIELADRCILAFTDPGDLVLDPFVGTGTTAICAEGRQRIGIGIELEPNYARAAQRRLELLSTGDLPLRRSGKAPTNPKEKTKVATRPQEWAA